MLQALTSLPDEIEKSLIEDAAVMAEWGKEGQEDREWTNQLISKFAERGKLLKYSVCATGHNGEWLYDLVWLNRQGGTKSPITDIPLILESEWGRRSLILGDFEKLLVGRARHRVMVFQESSNENVAAITKTLVESAVSCLLTQSADRYLFLGLNYRDYVFLPEV
jgi:hypothetical protein